MLVWVISEGKEFLPHLDNIRPSGFRGDVRYKNCDDEGGQAIKCRGNSKKH